MRYSQSDSEHPAPPSSLAQRAARCERISTGEEAQKQLNKILMKIINGCCMLTQRSKTKQHEVCHIKSHAIEK